MYKITLGDVVAALLVKTRRPKDNDFADRLSSTYTVSILITFSIVVFALMWIENPISCFVPQHFKDSHIRYTNSYCWVKNTYYLPFWKEIPRADEER